MTHDLSIRSQLTKRDLQQKNYQVLHTAETGGYPYQIIRTSTEVLLQMALPNGILLLFRILQQTDPFFKISFQKQQANGFSARIDNATGTYTVRLHLDVKPFLTLHGQLDYTPTLAVSEVEVPMDILLLTKKDLHPVQNGTVYHQQKQLRAGSCFIDFGHGIPGSLFYFQDLAALSNFCEDTQTSMSDRVSVRFPELGMTVPTSGRPLTKGKKYPLKDAYLVFNPHKPKTSREASEQYIVAQELVYRQLTRPQPPTLPLNRYAARALEDLATQHGCWQQIGERGYLNGYFADYHNPAESMVQLAVLAPLSRYAERCPTAHSERVRTTLLDGFHAFFDDKLGCFVRWIPEKAHHLDSSEEQKEARVMDSWYLHHPLIQLAALLQDGYADGELQQKFFSSLKYCIKVAQHFAYNWPVFYDLDTLEPLKEEVAPGAGGEKDVAGMYAFLMLKAHALSGKTIFITEARRAANSLLKYGFDLIYQSNNTAYAAEALLELYIHTGRPRYLQTSTLCLGNLVRNTAIWNRAYGHAKEYPSFFMLFPLTDAPYAAGFEESECSASFCRYLKKAFTAGINLHPALTALLAEYIKYATARIPFYFPPKLPKDILAAEAKTGYLHTKLWIPIEDIGDGWEPVGTVGQQLYGTGSLFELMHQQYIPLWPPDGCYINYPFIVVRQAPNEIHIQLLGITDYSCTLWLDPAAQNRYTVTTAGTTVEMDDKKTSMPLKGDQFIQIKWRNKNFSNKNRTSITSS